MKQRIFTLVTLFIAMQVLFFSCSSTQQVSCPDFKDNKRQSTYAYKHKVKKHKKHQKKDAVAKRTTKTVQKEAVAIQATTPVVMDKIAVVNGLDMIAPTAIATPTAPVAANYKANNEVALVALAPESTVRTVVDLNTIAVTEVGTPALDLTAAAVKSLPVQEDLSLTAAIEATPVAVENAISVEEVLLPSAPLAASNKEVKQLLKKQERAEKLMTKAAKKFDKKIEKQKKNKKAGAEGKSQLIALLLAIFVGVVGIHRFYLGYTGIGIAQLLTGGGCGIWTLIDIIRILTGDLGPADGEYTETLK